MHTVPTEPIEDVLLKEHNGPFDLLEKVFRRSSYKPTPPGKLVKVMHAYQRTDSDSDSDSVSEFKPTQPTDTE